MKNKTQFNSSGISVCNILSLRHRSLATLQEEAPRGSAVANPISSCKKQKAFTFLLGDEVLDDDVCHAVSVGIAILVEAVNRAENKLVAGDGPILAAQHLDKR